MQPLTLTRIDPAQNMRRFYRISIQPGLFGEVSLVREWGRIGTAGQCKIDWHEDDAHAMQEGKVLIGQKRRRGYR